MFRVQIAVFVLLSMLLSGCGKTGGDIAGKDKKDGVLVHITAGPDNPHRALMALQMAAKMSEDKPVVVYLDIDAVKLYKKGASDIGMEPFPSAFTQLSVLSERGVPVMACPGCLAVAGILPDSLMEGVRVADKATFFDFADGRIIALDY